MELGWPSIKVARLGDASEERPKLISSFWNPPKCKGFDLIWFDDCGFSFISSVTSPSLCEYAVCMLTEKHYFHSKNIYMYGRFFKYCQEKERFKLMLHI